MVIVLGDSCGEVVLDVGTALDTRLFEMLLNLFVA